MSAAGWQRHAGPGLAAPRLDAQSGTGAGIRQRNVRVAAVDRSASKFWSKVKSDRSSAFNSIGTSQSIHIRQQTCGS